MSDVLGAEWQVWVAEGLISGRGRGEIVADLLEEGVNEALARAEVDRIAAGPGVIAARRSMRAMVLSHRLRTEHLRLASCAIAVRNGLTGAEFRDEYVATQTPVILLDYTAEWPALLWTWKSLKARLGTIKVPVCDGRNAGERPAITWQDHTAELPFAELVDRILDPRTGDDLYMTANNAALGGVLHSLLEDCRPTGEMLIGDRLAKAADVWLGGAGTHTPPHHDVSDILFCQILGRKTILMAPPEEVEIADGGEGFWGDPEAFADLARRTVTVEAGQTLFIPAGWWHEVRSLEPSLTLTFAGMRHANDYRWFKPTPKGVKPYATSGLLDGVDEPGDGDPDLAHHEPIRS